METSDHSYDTNIIACCMSTLWHGRESTTNNLSDDIKGIVNIGGCNQTAILSHIERLRKHDIIFAMHAKTNSTTINKTDWDSN